MKNLFLGLLFASLSVFANALPELGSHFDNLLTTKDEKKLLFKYLVK